MVEFRPIIINLIIVSLFAVALITGAGMMALQNHASQSILNDTDYANLQGGLTSNIQGYYGNVSQAGNSFENSSVTTTSSIPFIDSIYGTWKVIKSAPMTLYNLIVVVVFGKLLGSPATAIITAVISIILIISIIFAVVKLVSTGESG